MYGTALSVQIENLMPFAGLGFVLGFIYDILGCIRKITCNNRLIVFVVDFSFCLFSAVSSYMLLLATANGFIRIYLLVAEILGAAIYFFTFGTLVSAVIRLISGIVKKLFSPVFTLKKIISVKTEKLKEKFLKNIKKVKNKFKKPLKDA